MHRLACKLLAKQVVDDYGIIRGVCLDLGCGLGWFGIELAKLTDLEVFLLDMDFDKLLKARDNALKENVKNRVHLQLADAHNLPFKDHSVNLLVCRGAVFFWERPDIAFKEVYRVMKTSAISFLGGAIGRCMPADIRIRLIDAIKREVKKLGPKEESEWWRRRKPEWLAEWLKKAGIEWFKFIPDPPGIWVEIRKIT
ncbi:class I SAM-dependent methyltransferase [Candidatus Bathyarchaeota archaeon]|nr:class I SAM-dependent methyltransferase [Candidatus Bathyarchaeota archaeon]